jgi:nucleotide-binding universal stress UspA family protein
MTASNVTPWQWPPKVVLAAVDFGEASARAVTVAGLVASAFDATVRALHAERFEPPVYFTVDQIERLEAERHGAEIAARRHLAEFVGKATEYPAEAVVLNEPPVDAILHAAGGVDLIVMGSHRRRGPARWWLGSVAEATVQHSPRPVMVVPAGAVVSDRPTVLVAGTNPATDAWASELGRAGGDIIDRVLDIDHCTADRLDRADVIVLPLPVETAQRRASHLAQVLEECRHVVLVVPVEPTLERTSS